MATTTKAATASEITTTIPGTNSTAITTNPVKPVDLKVVSNYAVVKDDANECVLNNITANIAAGEEIVYKCQRINKINTSLVVAKPLPTNEAINYTIRLDDVIRVTDEESGELLADEPVVMTLSVRHPLTDTFNNALLGTILDRLLGAVIKSDGTYRFNELMRGAMEPRVD